MLVNRAPYSVLTSQGAMGSLSWLQKSMFHVYSRDVYCVTSCQVLRDDIFLHVHCHCTKHDGIVLSRGTTQSIMVTRHKHQPID